MKYQVFKTIIATPGSITLLFDRNKKVVLDGKGGELSKADLALLDAYKTKDGKWVEDSYLVNLVKAGRLKFTGDKDLEKLFGVNLPEITEARKPKVKLESSEEVVAQIRALEAKMLTLQQAEAERAETESQEAEKQALLDSQNQSKGK